MKFIINPQNMEKIIMKHQVLLIIIFDHRGNSKP